MPEALVSSVKNVTDLSKIIWICPKAADELKHCRRGKVGRPRIKEDKPGLLETILALVQSSSATDDRKRSEMIRTVKSLSDLHLELLAAGYNLSRNTTYIRLLPRRENTNSVKSHIQTVPVCLSTLIRLGSLVHLWEGGDLRHCFFGACTAQFLIETIQKWSKMKLGIFKSL